MGKILKITREYIKVPINIMAHQYDYNNHHNDEMQTNEQCHDRNVLVICIILLDALQPCFLDENNMLKRYKVVLKCLS